MRSRILGTIELDEARLKSDLRYLAEIPAVEEEYDEFSNGFWKNIPLYNATGGGEDLLYRDLDGARVQPTPHAAKVPYLNEIVSRVYNPERLQMVRTRNLKNAVVIPHRDFVELDRDSDRYLRTFMVLEESPLAFHSDDDTVIHMRPGEIWHLDAAAVHSAVNFSDVSRQSLCVDLAFDDAFDEKEAFADPTIYSPGVTPEIRVRKTFTEERREGILGLARVLERENFRDILFLLAKEHFVYDVHPAQTYEWLVELAKRKGDDKMVEKAELIRDFSIGARALGERFSLTTW